MSVPQSGKIYKILRCHYIHLYGTVLTQLRILIKDSDNTLQTYELYGGYIKVPAHLLFMVTSSHYLGITEITRVNLEYSMCCGKPVGVHRRICIYCCEKVSDASSSMRLNRL